MPRIFLVEPEAFIEACLGDYRKLQSVRHRYIADVLSALAGVREFFPFELDEASATGVEGQGAPA